MPLRFVSQYFGHTIEWDGSTQRVLIDSTNSSAGFSIIDDIDDIDFTKIYEIDGTGKYSGYKRLLGYPYDDKYAIYYTGSFESYSVSYEDLKPENLQETIAWSYKGKTYTHTRSQIYSLFSEIITLESLLGASEGIINQEWLSKTFGNTYNEWLLQGIYSQEATRIVDRYLAEQANIDYKDRYSFIDIDLDTLVDDSIDTSTWILDTELPKETDEINFRKHSKRVESTYEWVMAFVEIDSLTGTVYNVVFEFSEMPTDYLDDESNSEDIFNDIRFKKVDGKLYINKEDLKVIGILS